MTLYRTGTESPIVRTLINAARNGKEVTAVVELRARFDEAANIDLATRLQEAGAAVAYGVVGHKCHAKMLLVVRREEDKIRRYVHLGTGNPYRDGRLHRLQSADRIHRWRGCPQRLPAAHELVRRAADDTPLHTAGVDARQPSRRPRPPAHEARMSAPSTAGRQGPRPCTGQPCRREDRSRRPWHLLSWPGIRSQ